MEKFNIKVERETYVSKKTGKENFTYFGGYTVLDIVFDDQMEANLVVVPYSMKDDAGNTISGNTYAVQSVDENGKVYECKIKPARNSDKELLNMLLG